MYIHLFPWCTGGSGAGQRSNPVVIVDGPARVIEVGEWLNLTCYTLNSEGLRLQWLKDGRILSSSASEGELVTLTTFTYVLRGCV